MCAFAGCRLVLHMHSAVPAANNTSYLPSPGSSNPCRFGSTSEPLPWGAAARDDDGMHNGYMLTTYLEELGALPEHPDMVDEDEVIMHNSRTSAATGRSRLTSE
jgi:hypothetical protein